MTRLGDKIPVETLDEIRLARIERTVLARAIGPGSIAVAPARARVTRGRVVAAVGACAALAIVWQVSQRSVPTPASAPFQISTGDSPTTVRIARAELRVASHSHLSVLEKPGDAVVVTLDDGRVRCDVDKRPHRPTFVVKAADVDVTVVGTRFAVERHGSEVAVAVERGVVRVDRDGRTVSLTAGDSWRTPGFIAAADVADPGADPLAGPGGHAAPPAVPDPGADSQSGSGAAGSRAAAETRASAEFDARSAPAHATRSPSRSGPRRSPEDRRAAGSSTPTATHSAHALSPFRPPSGLAPIMKAPPGSPADVERFYREQSIRTGDSDLASNALYSLAYWQLYRMRNAAAAVESAERYERRFRRGMHAESALWVRVSALCAADLDSRCRAAAHSYVRRYPGGQFSALAKTIVTANTDR